jgi:gas vesicle protein
MQRFIAFFTGILSGAFIGAVVALLLAPTSGDKLREQVQDQFQSRMDDIRTAVEQERTRLEAELEALKRGEIKIA